MYFRLWKICEIRSIESTKSIESSRICISVSYLYLFNRIYYSVQSCFLRIFGVPVPSFPEFWRRARCSRWISPVHQVSFPPLQRDSFWTALPGLKSKYKYGTSMRCKCKTLQCIYICKTKMGDCCSCHAWHEDYEVIHGCRVGWYDGVGWFGGTMIYQEQQMYVYIYIYRHVYIYIYIHIKVYM